MADDDDHPLLYMHGDLHIFQARSLRRSHRHYFTACGMNIHHRRNTYATVSVPQTTLARTRLVPNTPNPNWDESFDIPLAHPLAFLDIRIKNDDFLGADTLGKVLIPAEKFASGDEISGWFPVVNPPNPDTALRLQLKFTPCEKNPIYSHGIAGDPLQRGVRNTYFPLRKGGRLTLYQDAHVNGDEKFPKIGVDGGCDYEQGRCWEDICHAIAEAHHLVYVVGWSVFHKIRLIREPTKPLPAGRDLTLGELLKYKSQEGVRVLMLVWNDKTSYDDFFVTTVPNPYPAA